MQKPFVAANQFTKPWTAGCNRSTMPKRSTTFPPARWNMCVASSSWWGCRSAFFRSDPIELKRFLWIAARQRLQRLSTANANRPAGGICKRAMNGRNRITRSHRPATGSATGVDPAARGDHYGRQRPLGRASGAASHRRPPQWGAHGADGQRNLYATENRSGHAVLLVERKLETAPRPTRLSYALAGAIPDRRTAADHAAGRATEGDRPARSLARFGPPRDEPHAGDEPRKSGHRIGPGDRLRRTR